MGAAATGEEDRVSLEIAKQLQEEEKKRAERHRRREEEFIRQMMFHEATQ